jgi:hypothetical protein
MDKDKINSMCNDKRIYQYTQHMWIDRNISSDWKYLHDNVLHSYSYKDSMYTAQLFLIFKDAILNGYDTLVLKDNIYKLEEKMLSEKWDPKDFLAFSCIAVAKHSCEFAFSYDFSIFDYEPNSFNKSERLQGKGLSKSQRDKVYMTATVTGDVMGCALGAGASPVGSWAGAWAGTKIGFAVCSAVETIGSWAKIW